MSVIQSTSTTSITDIVIDEIELLLPDLKGIANADSNFVEELELDSLDIVEVVSRLETRLGVSIPEDLESSAESPRDLASGIADLMKTP